MAGECGAIGHDYLITESTVVCDMRLGHDQAIITDFSQQPATFGAAMNCHKLADPIPFADACLGRLAFVLEILGSEADRDKRKDLCPLADCGPAIDHAMGFKPHTVAQ